MRGVMAARNASTGEETRNVRQPTEQGTDVDMRVNREANKRGACTPVLKNPHGGRGVQ